MGEIGKTLQAVDRVLNGEQSVKVSIPTNELIIIGSVVFISMFLAVLLALAFLFVKGK